MIWGDQSHLFGERKIEKEDTTVRAITSLIINVAIRANVSPGMRTVYLAELLIHRPQTGTKKRSILATKRHKRHKINCSVINEWDKLNYFVLVLNFFFVVFVPFCGWLFFVAFCGENQRVVRGGRSMAASLMETPLWPP